MIEIFKKTYNGFEDVFDIQRDVAEALDPDYNPPAALVPVEFFGDLTVTITYKEGTSGS